MNTQTSKEGAAIRASGQNLAAEQTAVPAIVQSAPAQEKSEWQKAIDEGVCTVDEFCDQLLRLIDKWPDNARSRDYRKCQITHRRVGRLSRV